jgi:hypothetical protein
MSDEATNGAKTLAEALLAVQSELPTAIHKDAENPHFKSKYVTLDGLLAVTRPALNKHGIVLMQWPERAEDGELVLTTRLTHAAAGESHETSMVLLPPKGDPQGQGSAITYARRYSLMAILGLAADDDDDGNAGSKGGGTRGGRVPTVTEKQIEKFIKPQLARNKVPGERVKAVLANFGVKAVHELPIDKADEFVTACITPEPDPLASDVPPDMEGL